MEGDSSLYVPQRVGFVSTRLAGTDGVSLETAKWVRFFEERGAGCCFLAGALDWPEERSLLVEEAHFSHPLIKEIYDRCFVTKTRDRSLTQMINETKERLKEHLYRFLGEFGTQLLIVENALSIPLNIPLGLAICEVISETRIPTVAHHHDFYWERKRFLTNVVWEYLNMAFPPHLPSIRHVVLNSSAGHQLALRRGVAATIIPNVMDFENPPPPPDEYARDVRQTFGIGDDEIFVLQPTRVVKRKGIEHAIELVRRLGMKAKLIISYASGDEGHDYEVRVREYSRLMGVDTLFESDLIADRRSITEAGDKVYTIWDIYPHADLVTYPSTFEGFGNAFLEAIYFRRPIVVNDYSIFATDLKPKGFRVIELEDYVTEEALAFTREVLEDEKLAREMADHNYELGRRYYSFSFLGRRLETLLYDLFGV
jgi:glycosyltransferase involved in cell wall biosynthesis